MMMKKRKFGTGGSTKRPMPTPADRAASKAQDAMLKKVKPTKSEAETLASAARASKNQNAMAKYAKGGKVKPVDIDMKGLEEASRSKASFDTSGLEAKGAEARNLNAVRAKEASDAAKKESAAPKKQSFGAAFAAARKRGDKTFTWNGGSYGTKMKGEDSKPSPSSTASSSTAAPAKPASAAPAKPASVKSDEPRVGLRNTSIGRRFADILDKESARNAKSNQEVVERYKQRGSPRLAKLAAFVSGAKYAKGGSVSKRADGIAKKGKTKGKMR